MIDMRVRCPYCGEYAYLTKGSVIYGSESESADNNYWMCWPCDAYVGCHDGESEGWEPGTKPMGNLAKAELRAKRVELHNKFDTLWRRSGGMTRDDAYKWLAIRLGISRDECHIGMFDEAMCKKAAVIVDAISGLFL
jgi:hypothetical protein